MVVTKNKLAYRSDDGVYIVPLACLRPWNIDESCSGERRRSLFAIRIKSC